MKKVNKHILFVALFSMLLIPIFAAVIEGDISNGETSSLIDQNSLLSSVSASTSAPYWERVNSLLFYNNGRVGIGTQTPSRLLHIRGSSQLRLQGNKTFVDFNQFDGGDGTQAFLDMNFIPSTNSSQAILRMFRSTNTTGKVGLAILAGNNTTTTNAYIAGKGGNTYFAANNGNVGIGTSSPAGKLHVNGDIIVPSGNVIRFRRGSANNAILWQGTDDKLFLRQPNNNHMYFQTNGNNTRMTILNNGNVGIGTTSPSALLNLRSTSGVGVQVEMDATALTGGRLWKLESLGNTGITNRNGAFVLRNESSNR
ncbi:MAG TPA: hypothetical protein ENN77_00020, partial [Candidatus Wirthbacteria bacterium]|nr:hypothetical protein [Candidatus Wirthbacteria bacterium]